MIEAIRSHHGAGKPILAECGGMLYCLEQLDDGRGSRAGMTGIIAGDATIQPRLAALGMQQAVLPGGTVRGHTFHYSRLNTPQTPMTFASNSNGGKGEPGFRIGDLPASYLDRKNGVSGKRVA